MQKIDIDFFRKNLYRLTLVQNKKLTSIVEWLNLILSEILQKSEDFSEMLMPKKSEMADILNVGSGTVQNAYRLLEDKGLLFSKQCVGTFLLNPDSTEIPRKLTSKKDVVFNSIKKHLKKNNIKIGDKLNSIRYYAKKMKVSSSTILQIFEQMETLGIIKKEGDIRILISQDFSIENETKATLADKVYDDLKTYISSNFKIGDKFPPLNILSKKLNISIKTLHSAMKKLAEEGFLIPLSGRYGTAVAKIPMDNVFYQNPETSIFASAKETYSYHYEKILNIIRKMISDNFEIGSKLPSISELSLLLDVNSNTIRKTFEVLKDEGIVYSIRGRYGGTFVLEMPDLESTQSYQWLAVNSDFSM